MAFRKAILKLHFVVGAISGLLLIVSSLTGCVLVFEKELHVALNWKLMHVSGQGERLPLAALVEKFEKSNPDRQVTAIARSLFEDGATLVTMRARAEGGSTGVYVNPYTAEMLGTQDSRNQFMEQLRKFHRTLLLGEKGKLVPAFGAGSLIVLSLTGVFLWCRLRLWRWSGAASGRRRTFDLHSVVGIYASVSMVVFAFTGLGIFWEKDATRVVNRLLGRPEVVVGKPVTPSADALPLSVDRIVAIAQAIVPGATLMSIEGIGGLRNPVKLRVRHVEDFSAARRVTLLLDPTTGDVLSSEGPSFKLWNQEMHTGEILGWPTRTIALLASMALPLLAITGSLIWWRRRRPKSAGAAAD